MARSVMLEGLQRSLSFSGIDVVSKPAQLGWFNSTLESQGVGGAAIAPRGTAGEAATCLLVGNSKALWDKVLQACQEDGSLLAGGHPVDRYIERALTAALSAAAGGSAHRVLWSHQRTSELAAGAPGFVAIQRMAHAAGLAFLDSASHLCLHPRLGPWFSLRAVLVFDDLPWAGPAPSPLPDPLCPATRQYVALALASAVHAAAVAGGGRSRGASPPVVQGEPPAEPPGGSERPPSPAAVRGVWRRWVAVRDAPCPGHPWRYCEDQLQYHYTGDLRVLLAALRRRRGGAEGPPRVDGSVPPVVAAA